MTPSIAIAVPIGAYHPLLRDCIASLAAQSPLPLISALDASGDPRTAAVLEEFSRIFAYRRRGPDGGQTAAIVEGWSRAPGDIFGWLNADDALYPGALAHVGAHFRDHPDTDVFYGHSAIINDDFKIVGYHWAVEQPSSAILSGCIISQPSCFFRQRANDAVGGLDASLHFTMDWDLWTRLWKSGAKFRFTDQTLSRVLWSREAKTGGFGAGRRRELNRIIDANNSGLRRLKSRIGFGLHHALEYATPKVIAGMIRRTRRAEKTINGIGRSGGIVADAHLPIAWFGLTRASTLKIAAEVRRGSVAIIAGEKENSLTATGIATLAVSAAPSTAVTVRFRPSPGALVRLQGIHFE